MMCWMMKIDEVKKGSKKGRFSRGQKRAQNDDFYVCWWFDDVMSELMSKVDDELM